MKLPAAAALFAALPAAAFAQTQIEVTVGGGIGSRFTRLAPFTINGNIYGGPYRTCAEEVPAAACLQQGATDVGFALESEYPGLAVAGFEVRHAIGGPILLGAGVLGGFGPRTQRVLTLDTGEVVDGRPVATQDLANAANSDAISSTNGVGTLVYLHAGLRWERGFESRTPTGYQPSGTRVFAEAGGGLLAVLPGGGDGRLGHPPGFHLAGGLIFHRTSAHPLTVTACYVQALGEPEPLTIVDSRLSWFVVQVGWRLDGR